MIRFLILIIIAFVVFYAVLHFRGEEFTESKRKKAILAGLASVVFVVFAMFFMESLRRAELEEELLAIGYQALPEKENIYQSSFKNYSVSLEYLSAFEEERSVPRIMLTLTSKQPKPNVENLFCDSAEYERYLNYQYGGRYPTPEIKLPNGHFVGKCYPEAIKTRISTLPERIHDFVPKEARYLFLPSSNDSTNHLLIFYTENLDVATLNERLEELTIYYAQIFQP